MNRAERRRREKKAKNTAEKTKPGQAASPLPDQQTLNIQQSLEVALHHHRAGELSQAESILQQVLQADPNQLAALHFLGVVAHQMGNADTAVNLMSKALAIKPDYAEAHSNLGNVLQDLGKLDEAVECHQKALAINPDFAEAHNNLGNVYQELGMLDEAVTGYHKAITINPNYARAYSNLGLSLQGLGKVDEAVANHQKAIALHPDFAEAHNNLGVALQDLGKVGEAVASYQEALTINPDYAEAHNNLGLAFQKMEQLDDAVASYHMALALNPDFAKAHYNLGNALQDQGKLDKAVDSYHQALAVNPDYSEAHNNLGNVLKDLGRFKEAVNSCHRALDINPDHAEAHNNLGNILKALGRMDDAVDSYRKALVLKPDYIEAGRNMLLAMLYIPGLTPKDLFAEHLRFAEAHAGGIVRPAEEMINEPVPDRRLRIGYLSSDFRNHPTGMVVLPLISSHDPEKFEVFCYAYVSPPDAITKQFQSCVDHWRTVVGKPDVEVAEMIRSDSIDVLVCLSGRFDDNHPLVCAYRAAPVQVSLHDGATSGLKDMDYWLTDDFLHSPDTKEMFTEELHRLPVFYQWSPIKDAPPVEALPAAQEGFVTFGSFNNPTKINDEVIFLWAKVLNSVPGSRLLLKYINWFEQVELQDRVIKGFAAGGIDQDRIMFAESIDTFEAHLERYGGVDIALDPFPFNGATTTFQALWMGVPVIALAGETFISRAAGSILHHVGLGELVADSPEAYVACARDLAGDMERMRTLRAGLRARMETSPICDAPAYTRSVEAAYLEMWRDRSTQPKTPHDVKKKR